jgi:hypothetical protein
MNRLMSAGVAALVLTALATSPTGQTVYPTGATIYEPDRSWNGFTVLSPLGTAFPAGYDSLEYTPDVNSGNTPILKWAVAAKHIGNVPATRSGSENYTGP